MKRLILSLFALSFSFIMLSCGDDDNPVNINNPFNSIEWQPGTYWKYKYSNNGKILTNTITDIEVIADTRIYTVKYEMDGTEPYFRYWIYSPKGYNIVSIEEDIQNSLNHYIIKFPVKKGDTVHVLENKGLLRYTEITDENTTINTPAGEFKCFAFEMIEQIPGPYEKKILQKYFYSNGVGHVKTEYIGDPGYFIELIEYKPVVNFED